MEEEFTITTGWKIFYGIFALLLGAGGVFLLVAGLKNPDTMLPAVVGGLVIAGLAVLIGGQLRKKVIISADRIVHTNVLQTREIPAASVKGCRIGPKVIVIEADSPNYAKITINNYSDFANSADLVNWLKQNFKDLNVADLADERERLLQDTRLGATKEEREAKINNAKWVAIIYSAAGLIFGFASIPFDQNKTIAILLIVYPLLGIIIMGTSWGLIRFLSDSRKSVRSFIVLGFFGPVIMLCISSGSSYNILQYNNFYFPALGMFLVIAATLYLTGKNEDLSPVAGQVILMLIVAAGYSYGTILKINCLFDDTSPRQINTTIDSKFKEYSKGEHYYLWLNPLTTGGDKKQVEVGPITYGKYNPGDTVVVDLKKGSLNIPWYYLP
jgi:hypothetical protein